MRTFIHGTGSTRRIVAIEIKGPRMRMIQKNADGTTKQSAKELPSEDEARAAGERMARELISRGFTEQAPSGARKTASAAPASKSDAPALGLGDIQADHLFEDGEEPAHAAPVLPRLGTAPGAGAAAESRAPKKGGGKKKKKKKAADGDALDMRVIGAVVAVGVAFVAFVGYIAYDVFLKPPTIAGTWAGSMIEYEIGRPIIHTAYRLVLDEKHKAALTLQEKYTSVGTYTLQGTRLKLVLKDEKTEDGEEGETSEHEYKVALGRTTLDLYDPESGKRLVQLIRFREKPVVGGDKARAPAPPADLAGGAGDAAGKVDKAADERLASVQFAPKDGAFSLRHPQGWKSDTGSRPDNTYSWAMFTRGSAKIHVTADIAGSLMAGPNNAGEFPSGSELAPVHRAHERYKKTASEEYSDYKESTPAPFPGSQLGEGRISAFTASGGGLFGSKLRGYRVTLLTNDRRITLLCHCPEADFGKLKPTFLAVCRSVAH
jgi:hypothetical protein